MEVLPDLCLGTYSHPEGPHPNLNPGVAALLAKVVPVISLPKL